MLWNSCVSPSTNRCLVSVSLCEWRTLYRHHVQRWALLGLRGNKQGWNNGLSTSDSDPICLLPAASQRERERESRQICLLRSEAKGRENLNQYFPLAWLMLRATTEQLGAEPPVCVQVSGIIESVCGFLIKPRGKKIARSDEGYEPTKSPELERSWEAFFSTKWLYLFLFIGGRHQCYCCLYLQFVVGNRTGNTSCTDDARDMNDRSYCVVCWGEM